jgi:hypothetical protein
MTTIRRDTGRGRGRGYIWYYVGGMRIEFFLMSMMSHPSVLFTLILRIDLFDHIFPFRGIYDQNILKIVVKIFGGVKYYSDL